MYVLIAKNGIANGKAINHTNKLFSNEIEITEEQYNQINEFPLSLTLTDGKIAAWEKTIIPVEEYIEPIHEPTIEERVSAVEMALLEVL